VPADGPGREERNIWVVKHFLWHAAVLARRQRSGLLVNRRVRSRLSSGPVRSNGDSCERASQGSSRERSARRRNGPLTGVSGSCGLTVADAEDPVEGHENVTASSGSPRGQRRARRSGKPARSVGGSDLEPATRVPAELALDRLAAQCLPRMPEARRGGHRGGALTVSMTMAVVANGVTK